MALGGHYVGSGTEGTNEPVGLSKTGQLECMDSTNAQLSDLTAWRNGSAEKRNRRRNKTKGTSGAPE